MQGSILYLDVVFVINLFMNYILLWSTAKIIGFFSTFRQIILASSVGAFYSLFLIMYLPSFTFSLLSKFLIALIMVIIVFYPLNFKNIIKSTGCFYVMSCIAAGSMLGAIYFLNLGSSLDSSINLSNVKFTYLFFGAGVLVIIGFIGVKINSFKLPDSQHASLIIIINSIRYYADALVDTGNFLKEPITGKPVIITELNVFRDIFSCNEKDLSSLADVSQIYSNLDSDLKRKINVIPYNSVGKKSGMLLGLKPDEVIVFHENSSMRIKNVIIGIYNKRLSPSSKYNALMHPEVLHD